jgi:hypothetical protein
MKLLTRDEFRNWVFERDNHKCVICKFPAQDAHHILERRLFTDGGYYLDNGASLCGNCHVEAEETVITCPQIREAAMIKSVVLPEHFYRDIEYDKWGNIILPNGTRLKGELFWDESVQKILKQGGVLDCFLEYVKYPRTYHLPWSDCVGKDDRIITNFKSFEGKRVIVTEKMDGENTTMYHDYIHARSIDSKSHPTQSWVRSLHAGIRHNVKPGWRLCGENLYAKHSISYTELESFFYLFSVWDDKNTCLSWDETVEYALLLGVPTVPAIYDGVWSERAIREIGIDTETQEGYVVRIADSFPYVNFRSCVAKYVRKNHVVGTHHWRFSDIELNKTKR